MEILKSILEVPIIVLFLIYLFCITAIGINIAKIIQILFSIQIKTYSKVSHYESILSDVKQQAIKLASPSCTTNLNSNIDFYSGINVLKNRETKYSNMKEKTIKSASDKTKRLLKKLLINVLVLAVLIVLLLLAY